MARQVTGVARAFLPVDYWIIDARGYRRWTLFFVVIAQLSLNSSRRCRHPACDLDGNRTGVAQNEWEWCIIRTAEILV